MMVGAGGGKIVGDTPRRVHRDGGVEGRHAGADRGAGYVALRHESRSVGIADVDLEPVDQWHARAGRLYLGHAVKKAIGVGEVAGSLVAGVEQEIRPQLLGGVGTTLIDIAETDGAGGSERFGGRVVW